MEFVFLSLPSQDVLSAGWVFLGTTFPHTSGSCPRFAHPVGSAWGHLVCPELCCACARGGILGALMEGSPGKQTPAPRGSLGLTWPLPPFHEQGGIPGVHQSWDMCTSASSDLHSSSKLSLQWKTPKDPDEAPPTP